MLGRTTSKITVSAHVGQILNRGSAYVWQLPDYGATSCADETDIMDKSKLRPPAV